MNYEDIRSFFDGKYSESKTCKYAPDDYFWHCFDKLNKIEELKILKEAYYYNEIEIEEKPKETETKFQAIFCD